MGDNAKYVSATQYDHELVVNNNEVAVSNEKHIVSLKHVHELATKKNKVAGSYETLAYYAEKNHNGATNLNVVDVGEPIGSNTKKPTIPTQLSRHEGYMKQWWIWIDIYHRHQ